MLDPKEYFDQDYYETEDIKSTYSTENYNRSSYIYEALVVWLNEFIPLSSKKILDNGCGYGYLLNMLLRNDFDAYGQDISPYAVQKVKDHVSEPDRVLETSDHTISFDEKFNVITEINVLEHMSPSDAELHIEEVANKLSSGGIMFAIINLGWNNDQGDLLDKSVRTLQPRSWWHSLFSTYGLTRREDLEADAYEIGVQTNMMESGLFLARHHNWHVFVYEKGSSTNQSRKVYDRRLATYHENRPKLLILGSREAQFKYPLQDFFQVDNWGNYLSHFMEGEYKHILDIDHEKINLDQYDVVMAALDNNVVSDIGEREFIFDAFANTTAKTLGFVDGTLAMAGEETLHRETSLRIFNEFDALCPIHDDLSFFLRTHNVTTPHHFCSHIFPLRWFDMHTRRKRSDDFNILCTGMYDSHTHLASYSLFMASKLADHVYMGVHPRVDISALSMPDNCSVFHLMPQETFYSQILSSVSMVIRMDNPPTVGRASAEAAAIGIPMVGPADFYQRRCFPEQIVSSIYKVDDYFPLINRLKEDKSYLDRTVYLARQNLIASNETEFHTMCQILKSFGIDAERPEELYW